MFRWAFFVIVASWREGEFRRCAGKLELSGERPGWALPFRWPARSLRNERLPVLEHDDRRRLPGRPNERIDRLGLLDYAIHDETHDAGIVNEQFGNSVHSLGQTADLQLSGCVGEMAISAPERVGDIDWPVRPRGKRVP